MSKINCQKCRKEIPGAFYELEGAIVCKPCHDSSYWVAKSIRLEAEVNRLKVENEVTYKFYTDLLSKCPEGFGERNALGVRDLSDYLIIKLKGSTP